MVARELRDVRCLARAEQRRVHRRGDRRGRLETERKLAGSRGDGTGCREIRVGRRQARDQRAELQVSEQVEDGGAVVAAPLRAVDLELHRKVRDDRCHDAALEDLLPARGERFAQLGRESRQVGENPLEVAVLCDELRRGLVPHAGNPGDVVGGIALERLEVDHLRWLEPIALVDLGLVVDDRVLETHARGEELGVRGHQLERIEVARDDHRLEAGGFGLACERTDDIIGLVPR